MEPPPRFPVFFELSSPPDADVRRKLHSYFHIRRKSGGGECGAVTRARDTLYCVLFKEREAQQRVLERCQHVLECGGGSVVLTVRGSAELPGSASSDTPPTEGPTSSQRQRESTSIPPPTGEEYEVQPDAYLLQYFAELGSAREELESEFASVGCTAQLLPEEGRVLVRRLAGAGGADQGRSLKGEVDALLDGYQCHYELDPPKVKALLQSCSSHQSPPGEVKVYSEVGMAVAVGKRAQVQARLRGVEGSTAQLRKARASEKQSSTHRLGEAKLRLLWEAIESGLGRSFPEVEVAQGDGGQVVLEGSSRDVVRAKEWIVEKEKEVLERTVPNMSLQLLAFVKKTHGGPGQLRDLLGVGGEVEAELRDTGLRLFSLSPGKLDEPAEKAQAEFAEIKIDLSSCPVAPQQLWEKLKSEASEMNRGSCRVRLLGADRTACLLGHAREVEELNHVVTQFVLDQANVQGKVSVRFPELEQHLAELLQLHAFDHSGVTFRALPAAAAPTVGLEGPSGKVAEVQRRLRPFLDSLVRRSVTIDLPGAARFFESDAGRQSVRSVARSQKCLLRPPERPPTGESAASAPSPGDGGTVAALYGLRGGLRLLVSHGDITKVAADVLVNAANAELRHEGGVAAALSKAGGPEVQRESDALVRQIGKIPAGNVVVTTGGRLRCKLLLHAVGPVAGASGGREKALLEQVVRSALQMADDMELESVALPCISSGLFGVPVAVCAEAIVTTTRDFSARSLRTVTVIDSRAEVVRAVQEACDRLLPGSASAAAGPPGAPGAGAAAAAARPPGGVDVEIVRGTIETQQVDALLCPMVGQDLLSTRVGNVLANLVGPQLTAKFQNLARGAAAPGDVVLVDGLSAPHASKALIFLHLLPWDNDQNGRAAQALRRGFSRALASCGAGGRTSVALPVLGTSAALRFPHAVAARLLLEEALVLERGRAGPPALLLRVVVHPSDKESAKAFESTQQTVRVRGFTNHLQQDQDQSSFYRHVSATDDTVTAMLGQVQLQMVVGNIVNAGTDVIVNTTDFCNHSAGVSNAILTAAGLSVRAELAAVGVPADHMYTSSPGLLPCCEIIHASFTKEPQTIQKNCKKILRQCENKRYLSVGFPAVSTGLAGLDSAQACKAMLDGMAAAIRDLKPHSLALIRIVILQPPVFQAFRWELESRYGQSAPSLLTLTEKATQKLKKWMEKRSRASEPAATQPNAFTSPKPPPAVLLLVCRGPDVVETVTRDLEGALLQQLTEREVSMRDVSRLDDMELAAVLAKVRAAGISVEPRGSREPRRQQSADGATGRRSAARGRQSAGEEGYLLRGLKEDVLSVTELINRAAHHALRKDMQEKKEAMTALNVQWSVQSAGQVWQELSLRENFLLEDARINNRISVDVATPNGPSLTVNLRALEATDWTSGSVCKVKRNETGAALELPLQWEPMNDKVFQKLELRPNSMEYKSVAARFLETAKYNIRKIERVQNLYLWQAYSVCRQRILLKNGPAELGEQSLYHGTAEKSCDAIEKDRFDRNYAGAHGTLHGKGVYFAVHAQYSAKLFAPPDLTGLKRVYAARVLTGRYTVGSPAMVAPPPRGSDPTDRFDSLVDRQQNPTMFVVFHDDQAYPEYLITFS